MDVTKRFRSIELDTTKAGRPTATQLPHPPVDASAPTSGPIAELLSFHDDIRNALDALAHCGHAARRGDVDRAAATYLMRFFRGPMLWHDEDEEVSLLRRLRAASLTEAERAWVDATHRGHDRMEQLLESIVPMLARLANGDLLAEADTFDRDCGALHALLDGHLKLEETAVFPLAARVLTPADVADIAREIDARHGRTMAQTHRARRVIPL